MNNQLGSSLKKIRKQQQLSQKEVAQNICAQSMLSAIENGKYMPSARLLIKLCNRLSVSLDEISLLNDFAITDNQDLNNQLTLLCNNHDYLALKEFLLNSKTIARVQTAEQTQAYYYYLGVACLHVNSSFTEAELNLKLAISSNEEIHFASPLKRLALISLSLIKAKQDLTNEATKLLAAATYTIEDSKYEENLNIVFYLAALINYELTDTKNSVSWLEKGIFFITKHDSHYMLANCYHLLAIIAKNSGNIDQQLEAQRRSNFLQELFGEKINENL